MPDVVVTPVRTRRDRRDFVNFAWEHYRGDPNWIPPLRTNHKQLLGYKRHPFQEIGEIQTFLARRNGKVCGRVAAILDHAFNNRFNEQRGFFGFFESIDDPSVAEALFNAVRDWHAERGVRAIRGPVNPSMNYECALLVDGFDSPPTFMMTYNKPYYAALIEGYGYRKVHDLYAYFGRRDRLPEIEERLSGIVEQAKRRSNVTIRPLNRHRFHEDVELFLELYNRALVAMWGFVPLSDGELRHLAADLRYLLVPELALVAESDGKPVGVILAIPDYNPFIKEIDGRLFPFGFLNLLRAKKRLKRVRIVSINVLPEFQRWGVGLVLMSALTPKSIEMGIEEAEFSWVSETNDMARMGLEKGGAEIYKTYRIYDIHPEAAKITEPPSSP